MRSGVIICLVLFGIYWQGQAQVLLLNDDFEDGDIAGWTEGTSGDWTASGSSPINGSFSLKHNLSSVSGTSRVVQQVTTDPSLGTMTWQLQWKNGSWDPSGQNRWWFYLMFDQANITTGTQNGYAVGINMGTANDQVALYKVSNGAYDSELISAGPSYDINGGETYGIRVIRTFDGNWEMFIDSNGGFTNLVSVGTAVDNSYAPQNPWIGAHFQYTSSRAGQLHFDDIRVETNAGLPAEIRLVLSDSLVREGARVKISAVADKPVDTDKTFTLSASGTASPGQDFDPLPSTITIPAGSDRATIQLKTHADALFESLEDLNIELGSNGQSNIIMIDSTARLDIEDYVRVMHYNLLRYPSATNFATKNADLRKILDYLQPDILGVNELDRSGGADNADSILIGALNVGGVTKYARALHENSTLSPISNMLFYNTDKFALHSQDELIVPGERNPNAYHLYYTYPGLATEQDTIWLHVIQVHLKAGSASSDSLQRITVADSIMKYMDRQTPGNWLLMGDLNVYTSAEEAYQLFTDHSGNPPAEFRDPINRPGAWSEDPAFADVHTQSTRLNSEPDGGAGGGMDDRFDFILMNAAILAGTDSITLKAGSYEAVGQDSLHFNDAVNAGANAAVPDSIADALYSFSDHLPVIAGLHVTYTEAVAIEAAAPDDFEIFPNPSKGLLNVRPGDSGSWRWELYDLRGMLLRSGSQKEGEAELDFRAMAAGIYIIRLSTETYENRWNRLIISR